ncbi:MAG: hypothetical protein IPG80_16190 [Anaerolineales bacterium]|uniref:hypothetical protein n=1 Tax=Candidatus Villigracilis vicinus TaxID=3140679 RepID=UPI003135A57C|nr:hypothetical protein [Anaerolineales bacterium]MBK7451789.1 hypothetical protein [Anaerolineales bacterium]
MMRLIFSRNIALAALVLILLTACAPQAATPTVDIVGTTAAQLAVVMLTQTAGAVTATPIPPTETPTPAFTDTPSGPPTDRPQAKPAALIAQTGCWTGPGDTYTLISNIELNARGRKNVIILGMGTEPGWVVIRNPYFNNPCWVRIENMDIDPNMDMSQFPPMTPGP